MLNELHTNPTQLVGLLAFGVALAACARAAVRSGAGSKGAWCMLTALQAAFFIEVVLGLRHRIHDLIDADLLAGNWYDERKALQLALLCVVALVALAVIGALLRWRGLAAQARVAMAASVITAGSFVVETISMHDIDSLMYATIGPVMQVALLWAASAATVAVMAIRSVPGRGPTRPAFRR